MQKFPFLGINGLNGEKLLCAAECCLYLGSIRKSALVFECQPNLNQIKEGESSPCSHAVPPSAAFE